MWSCAVGPLSGKGLSLVIKAHAPLQRMPLNVQGSLPVDIPACLCSRAGLFSICSSCENRCCSLWSSCILDALVVFLCMWEVSLTTAHTPWLSWLVSHWLRVSACPSGLACPSGHVCLPYDDCVCQYPFPFYHKGYNNVLLVPDLLPFYHRVVSLSFYHRAVCQCTNVLGFASTQISLPLPQGCMLMYCCISAIWVFLYYRYLPSWGKKSPVTVWNALKIGRKLSINHWIPLLLTPC